MRLHPPSEEFSRVLVVGAHPDDAEFFAGGTIAGLVRRGARVDLAVCTDGGKGGRGLGDVVELRQREQAEATELLGVAGLIQLGRSDGRLEPDDALRKILVHHIRRLRPELVLTHDPRTLWTATGERVDLGHSDHRAAGQALLDAVYPRAASPNFYPEAALEPWCPRQVWLFDTAEPDLVVDVTEEWETKLEALGAHASQEEVARGLSTPALGLAKQLGQGERLGEGFVRLRIW
jgi:LmbE family N-acetylglucosaminyl deacetylase